MRWPSLILVPVATLTLAACGGSSSPPAPGTPQHPLVATTQAPAIDSAGKTGPSAGEGRLNESSASTSSGSAAAGKSKGTASSEVGQPSGAGYEGLLAQQKANKGHRFTPCNLVSEARAAKILGGPIQQPLLAPQGPTCIYRSRDGKGFVTVAVQVASFKQLESHVREAQRFNVSGRSATCGKLGQPVLYVGLKSGRVLSVAAPCDIARQFAASAVPQLS
jgi:hypothetical protein